MDTLLQAIGQALQKGGPAAGVMILLAWLGLFDLPLPGDQPQYMNAVKPLLVIAGAKAGYSLLPRRQKLRVCCLMAGIVVFLVALWIYRYFSDVPPIPKRVLLHLTGAWVSLGLIYLMFGLVVRELTVFLMEGLSRKR